MIINTNSELSQVVSLLIKTSGYKKTYIADKLGLTRQGLDKLLKKQSFSPECFKSLFCYFLINRCTAIMFSIIYIQSHKTLITKRIMKVKRKKHSSYAE